MKGTKVWDIKNNVDDKNEKINISFVTKIVVDIIFFLRIETKIMRICLLTLTPKMNLRMLNRLDKKIQRS